MINIVTFFAPRYLANNAEHAHDYGPMLDLLARSCARLQLRFIVITDPSARLGYECFAPALPEKLMPSVLAGQLAYLKSPLFDADSVLVDVDVLVQRNPAKAFRQPFDLALTGRRLGKDARNPINNGVMFCRLAARERCVAFFERALALCGEDWGADQKAINDACAPAPRSVGLYERSGAAVRVLPVKEYAAAPKSLDDERARRSMFLHFKGDRKGMMRAFLDRIDAAALAAMFVVGMEMAA